MSNLNEFTDDEIREQLELLGFKNVSKDKFNQFKSDLEKLIAQEVSINSNTSYSEYYQNKKNNDNDDLLKTRSNRARSISPVQVLNNQEYSSDKFYKNKKVTFPDESQLIDGRYEEKNEEDAESDQSFASIVTTSSIVDNKVLKRKVIRKKQGSARQQAPQQFPKPSANNDHSTNDHFCNEFNELRVSDDNELEQHAEQYADNSEFEDGEDENLVRLNDCYPPIQLPLKSFIRSESSLSIRSDGLRPGVKSNPVNRFHEYNRLWNKQKVPGEKKHSDLRWSIREQMLVKDVIVKRQPKSYEQNEYIIPTDKKRQQLRWAVRSALANQF